MQQATDKCAEARAKARRHAAGEDPAKRAQILDGAAEVFMEKGFDAATMNDVCRAAGVSKGTIYVYFQDKVDLFEALIAEKRDFVWRGFSALLEGDLPLEEKLRRFGVRLCALLCSEDVIRAQRIIAGTVERMPEVGARFYEAGSSRTQATLRALLERERDAGRFDAPDLQLAAAQFMELAGAGVWRPRLFGKMREAPTDEDMERIVASAVTLFLRAYGKAG